jgi:mono/diheme cytochrome c family protein
MKRYRLLSIALAAAAGLVFAGWYKLFRHAPSHYSTAQEEFKYGSVGVEGQAGIPYWIWLVLPRVFADKLPGPGGYAALGASWEPGRAVPIGFTYEVIGFPRVGVNCASCHTTSVRTHANGPRAFYPGGPTSRFRPQDYVRFLLACANDPRFTSDRLMREILAIYDMPWIDRVLYRRLIIPFTRRQLLKTEREQYAWMASRPDWGPGRTDMNPFRILVLGLPDDGTVGSTDIMAIWNQGAHGAILRHSDGLNATLTESVRAAALASGATRRSINIAALDRIERLLLRMPQPRYPYPVDTALAARGAETFRRECAECHAFGGARVGKEIPPAELGTDENRLRHWSRQAADSFNRWAEGTPWAFRNFRGSEGYVALPLDGVWLRAPYLHNGSVPSLRRLLDDPAQRPQVFYRGYDVYDPQEVGFVSAGREAETEGFRYDTDVRGNGNAGHLWGTRLPAESKRALIEYMKTL